LCRSGIGAGRAQDARGRAVSGRFDNDERVAQPFFEEMAAPGWTEGTNITYERLSGRGAREYVENLAKIAADLEPH
jgi:hypothetical protein